MLRATVGIAIMNVTTSALDTTSAPASALPASNVTLAVRFCDFLARPLDCTAPDIALTALAIVPPGGDVSFVEARCEAASVVVAGEVSRGLTVVAMPTVANRAYDFGLTYAEQRLCRGKTPSMSCSNMGSRARPSKEVLVGLTRGCVSYLRNPGDVCLGERVDTDAHFSLPALGFLLGVGAH